MQSTHSSNSDCVLSTLSGAVNTAPRRKPTPGLHGAAFLGWGNNTGARHSRHGAAGRRPLNRKRGWKAGPHSCTFQPTVSAVHQPPQKLESVREHRLWRKQFLLLHFADDFKRKVNSLKKTYGKLERVFYNRKFIPRSTLCCHLFHITW